MMQFGHAVTNTRVLGVILVLNTDLKNVQHWLGPLPSLTVTQKISTTIKYSRSFISANRSKKPVQSQLEKLSIEIVHTYCTEKLL